LLVSAAQSFAVDRHNSLQWRQTKLATQCRHERCESPRQLHRIEQPEDTAESIVARHAMLEWNDLAQFRQPPFAELGDLHEALRPTQCCRQRNKQHFRQYMLGIRIARVVYLAQNRHHRHWAPSTNRGLLKNPSVHFPQYSSYSNAIPLPSYPP